MIDGVASEFHTLTMLSSNEISAIAQPDGMAARAYTDPHIFEAEMDCIFRSAWVFVYAFLQKISKYQKIATNVKKYK